MKFQLKIKPDSSKRDYERVPLSDDIEEYFNREVNPHLEDSWMDRSKDKVGYEINFSKYFFNFKQLRDPDVILREIQDLDQEIFKLESDLYNDCK